MVAIKSGRTLLVEKSDARCRRLEELPLKGSAEGSGERIDAGLEAIILEFGRSASFVKDDAFDTKGTSSSSKTVGARAVIEISIPSIGRMNLRNHPPCVGTDWVLAPGVLATNRHVARIFAERQGDAFVFIGAQDGRKAKAYLDTYREHQRPKGKRVQARSSPPDQAAGERSPRRRLPFDPSRERRGRCQPRAIEVIDDHKFGRSAFVTIK